ncbi:HTH-type transcriptional regulator CynR [Roseovarius litorisediminis]|uniref:HTH-type transcriptional regulator CynR n=1 Tax=Roseovarius litorisediminis TaxID=1312363 RepID=A0A1Y5REL4_9RHOB|nr:LysR substrate-binding domain-containing protein [Roseovarius litorisediminis]SLN15310.1 HTH-type transcriptional regulator CynR [Roseovarius litorisediminis]
MDTLDSDLLRTFLAIADAGSVTDGAARIFRSQSAASLQIKRLEETLGQPVFDRHGRGVTLTEAGEQLIPVAREVTSRLDQTLRSLRADGMTGSLRIGVPDDHSHRFLAQIIAEFAQSHPSVELHVTCDLSARFPQALANGALDLAVYEVERPDNPDSVLWRDQTYWVASRHHDLLTQDVLPVALFDRDCWWRDAALEALNRLGRPYRVIFSSQSVTGVAAAIEAGIAIGLLGESSLNDTLVQLTPEQGFAVMPVSNLVLGTAGTGETPARKGMTDAIRRAFQNERF